MKRRGQQESGGGLCLECDPPEAKRRELGSRIGQFRSRHYLTFRSAEELEAHLKACAGPIGDGGYPNNEWRSTVIRWFVEKKAARAAEARRWPDVGPEADTRLEGGSDR